MEKNVKAKKIKEAGITISYENAAGIDLGSKSHYACVPKKADSRNVREFKCFTADIHRMAEWFKKCGITTVAMESTGVEWIPVYDILQQKKFEVVLVNARDVKNVPGRKTDVKDCQWIQQLHSYGLLSASFRPNDEIVILRGYVRHRNNLIKTASIHINRIQKALTQMNIHLHKALSDITGVSGFKIIEAIINGERDPIRVKLHNPDKMYR